MVMILLMVVMFMWLNWISLENSNSMYDYIY